MSEDFRLKWNDHHSVFFSAAEQLCLGDHLTDVTLSCGEKEFSAHKLVLSICSGYFHQLFTPRPLNTSRRRPADLAAIVYLKDVDAKHMEMLLSYMYRGEINVEESELMGFLATARSLQIKGLTESDNEEENQAERKANSSNASKSQSSSRTSTSNTSSKRPNPRQSQNSKPKKIKEEVAVDPTVEQYDETDSTEFVDVAPGEGFEQEDYSEPVAEPEPIVYDDNPADNLSVSTYLFWI